MLDEAAIARLRAETPGCADVIHLGNAGSALPPQVVVETVIAHLRREAEIGGYEAAAEAEARHEAVYDSAARLINAHREEIALVDNATRAFDLAFHAMPLEDGDRILTSTTEYGSNYLAYLRRARDVKLEIVTIPEAERGELSLDALQAMLREPRVRAVAISHVPTQSGLVQPVVEVGRLTRAAGCWYLLDATQSAGQIPLDVEAIGCDALATTGRKYLRGPRATGFLYVRRERLDDLHPPMVDIRGGTWTGPESYELRPDARRFEVWEQYIAGLLGLGVAIEYALDVGLDVIGERVHLLADGLRERLTLIPGVTVHDRGAVRCGIVSLTVDGHSADAVRESMAAHEPRINVTKSTTASALLDFPARGLSETVRASVHYYNTESELETFARAVERLAVG